MKTITIFLAEDHAVVREAFRHMFDQEAGLAVVGEAGNGRQAVQMCLRLRPDVVLMDIAMPRLNGLEAARQILRKLPQSRILILTAHNDDAYVQDAVAAGAAGFLLKQSSAAEVCRAVRAVVKGGTHFSPSIARHLNRLQAATSGRSGETAAAPTRREREVLQLVAEGRANKECAAELGISIKTVEKHRENLMRKLDIHDTAGLTRHAIATGIIQGGPGPLASGRV